MSLLSMLLLIFLYYPLKNSCGVFSNCIIIQTIFVSVSYINPLNQTLSNCCDFLFYFWRSIQLPFNIKWSLLSYWFYWKVSFWCPSLQYLLFAAGVKESKNSYVAYSHFFFTRIIFYGDFWGNHFMCWNCFPFFIICLFIIKFSKLLTLYTSKIKRRKNPALKIMLLWWIFF